ncbi:MAG: cysteine synthase family protein [Bacteroidetes bacterium]|nr:cysteine synthase family protein [Bacteroidota bacterium]MBP7399568.1 cysteine synthase family protein [Chitinophagales bacterium]MBK8487428.1 cysteine synthase family protein [Bacteroidota bacterium]MBK8682828.1 cysteine synthase family protein [Bacteroidota bacterium]MBP8753869.1 cysteine synthase family protein [Chitinophagales bacterium]
MRYPQESIENKFKHLWCMVGNTPMLEIRYTYKGNEKHLFVKCEHYNLTGSIKDRMALYILENAYKAGLIHSENTIIEATSGNTGISFSAIGKALGNRVIIIMPNWLSKERMDIIRSLGAEIILMTKEEGGFLGSIKKAEQMAKEDNEIFLPRQFDNKYNIEAHEKTTAKEIWMQLQQVDLEPHAFVAGVGTGGTVMGVAAYFKKRNPNILVCPLEPHESPTLSTGYKVGTHRIQGISDEFIPSIVKLDVLDHILKASDGDSIIMAQKLARQLGLAVGISSGANIIGAIQLQNQLGDDANVVTIFCDSNKKYLSTDLMKEESVKENYFSTDTEFIDYVPISRMQ